MARTPIEDHAISRKIVRLTREGYPQRQATAIAFRMFKEGELSIPRTQDQAKKDREKRRRNYFRDRRKRTDQEPIKK